MNRTIRQTKTLARFGPVVVVLWLACLAVQGQGTNAPARLDSSAFRIISDRNIFNQNRSPRTPPPPRITTSRDRESRSVRSESITLSGIMGYEKGPFAFFVGSSPQYHAKVQSDDRVAGYRVAEIGLNYVKLEKQDRQIELRLGMQLRRQDGGEWRPPSQSELAETRIPVSSSSEDSGSSGAGDEENEILRRLMQKREQELNR